MKLPIILAAAMLVSGCVTQMTKSGEIPLIDAPGSKSTIHAQITPGKYETSIMAQGDQRDLAQQQGRHLGFVNSPHLDTYLNGIRGRLLASSGVTEVPGKVLVEANTSLQASATADGNILISMAWMPDVTSEDELAAIIGHELAHVLLKHQSANIVGLTQKRLQSAYEMLVGGRMAATNATQVTKMDARALLAAQVSVELMDKLVMPAWNRRQETEADLLGLDLMIRAGYAPSGMTRMLETLRASEASSHASEEDLQKQLAELAAKSPDKAIQLAWKSMIAEISKEHPDTDKRIDAVAEYENRHYDTLAPREPSTKSVARIKSDKTVSPLIRNYQHAIRAKKHLLAGNGQAAYKEALLGVQAPTSKDPLPNWILWQTAGLVGKQAQHAKALDYALHSGTPIPEVYQAAIASAEQSGNYQQALNLVNEAGEKFGDAPEWAPDRIRLLRKLGRTNEASALALKCAMETPQLRQACYDAGKS